ncbi:MAG: hypothetical protein SOZ67_04295 [Alloprevotella sp.]|nr:hypothetical protein [Bacteroidales bacterium]MDY3803034.1 hypothetical protein [Alloprevotella sp.]MDY4621289.1 hypothetical protein [Alloprevotella sp.]
MSPLFFVPLNAVEGKSYATTYLSFDVTLPADVKALSGGRGGWNSSNWSDSSED